MRAPVKMPATPFRNPPSLFLADDEAAWLETVLLADDEAAPLGVWTLPRALAELRKVLVGAKRRREVS